MKTSSVTGVRIDGVVRRIATVIHGMRQMFRGLIMRRELRRSVGTMSTDIHPRLRIRRRLRLVNRIFDIRGSRARAGFSVLDQHRDGALSGRGLARGVLLRLGRGGGRGGGVRFILGVL